MTTSATGGDPVFVRGKSWRALYRLWGGTACGCAALDMLPAAVEQAAASQWLCQALSLGLVLVAAIGTFQKRGPLMWLHDRQLYQESLWTGVLLDLSELTRVESTGAQNDCAADLLLRCRGRDSTLIHVDDWRGEDLRRLVATLVEQPGICTDRGVREFLANPAAAPARRERRFAWRG
jgi:hypothetical protein